MSNLKLEWRARKIDEWRELLLRVPRTNYLQSLPFSRAVLECDKKNSRLAVIKQGDVEIGLMAIHEIKFGPIHVLHLYRGPLWFQENVSELVLAEFAQLFNEAFPRRFLRIRRWLPEWKESALAVQVLTEMGFKLKKQSYETIYLDLSKPTEQLRLDLKSNWRNHLASGERSGLRISVDWKGTTAKLFLHKYDLDRKQKKYFGRSKKFMRSEMSTALAYNEMFIIWGVKDERSVAAILVLIHGKTASYRLGWTTDLGRECSAHNVLLWEAVKILKERGIRYFDLVGVEPSTADGVTKFKQGMGGISFKTVGMFR